MKLTVITIGGPSDWAAEACADWIRRLRRHGGIDVVELREEPFRGDVELVREAESRRILARVTPRDRLVVVDERGEDLDSLAFSRLIDQGRQAAGGLIFAVGGSWGHHANLRERAWRVVRLSSLVLNHDVARVVLFEQLYRGFTLLDGTPYHH